MPLIGGVQFVQNRRELYSEPEEMSEGLRNEIVPPNLLYQVVETSQVFSEGGIPGGKIGPIVDTGNAGITSIGDGALSIRGWAGASFENRNTAPFKYDRSGNVTATSITMTGGTIKYGKTDFSDSVNAGYYIGAEGIYVGDAGDASKLKYTISDGSFDFIGTVSSRSTLTIANAIDASGNLVTDIINAKLDSSAKTILADFNFGSTDYAGAVKSGDITWNTSTGAITGGSGVVVYRSGIVGAAAGVTTFSIDATTGAAIFAGQITSGSGAIGGWTLGSTSLSASSGAVGLSSATTGGNDIRFWAGNADPTLAPFKIYEDGAAFMSSATIAGYKLFGAIVDPAGDGDYTTIAAAIAASEKSIFLRNGVHVLSADLTIAASDVEITGESRDGAIVRAGTGADWQIKITGGYCVLRNFTVEKLEGNKAVILLEGGRNLVDSLLVKGPYYEPAYGIYSSGGYNTVQNCDIRTVRPIYVTNSNNTIVLNKLKDPYGSGKTLAYLNGGKELFKDNIVEGEGAVTHGIVHVLKNQATIVDNFIDGENSNAVGIWVEGAGFSTITGNRISRAGNGMRVYTADATIISHNNMHTLSSVGVWLGSGSADLDNCIFSNNSIRNCSGDGIRLGGVINVTITNNLIDSAGAEGIDQADRSVFECNISHNTIINCGSHGLWTASTSTCRYNNIIGNQINYNGGRGFLISASNCNIVANVTRGNTTANSITNTSGNTQFTLV